MFWLFHKFFSNIAALFKGRNLAYQLAAIILTAIFALSGFDWWYFEVTRFIPRVVWIPAAAFGGLLPILVPLTLLTIGYIVKNKKTLNFGFALGQAGIIGLLFSFFYKSLTGRVHPPLDQLLTFDISNYWRFGFMRGGVFWGWPSSHTTVAFATAVTLIYLFPKNKIVKCLALVYAFYIGLAVSTSIHWFSEFIAGAIFGTIVGIAVGTAFYKKMSK